MGVESGVRDISRQRAFPALTLPARQIRCHYDACTHEHCRISILVIGADNYVLEWIKIDS